METVILIPIHNRRETTLGCLRTLQATGDLARHPVWVIDDGSTDDSAGAIRREFPAVTVLPGSGHLWWTGAIRLGMNEAFGQGARSVVWLNDDCWPAAGAIDRLVAHLVGEADVVGATCLTGTGDRETTGVIGRHRIVAGPGELRPVEALSGYCVAVSRRTWERVGPPDARRFPHYLGDIAYTLQAHRAGQRVRLTGDALVELRHYSAPREAPAAGSASWAQVFRAEKSRFRLATQWHYLQLKYGPVTGSCLALARTVAWQIRFLLGR